MDNLINYIEISNFKSIRNLELTGFKKVNLFIGRPNVGKSNLLEALSLFSTPYILDGSKRLTDLVRLGNQREIFHEGNLNDTAFIQLGKLNKEEVSKIFSYINFNRETNQLTIDFDIYRSDNKLFVSEPENSFLLEDISHQLKYGVDAKFKIIEYYGRNSRSLIDYIKRYNFNPNVIYKEHKVPFLFPPFGTNLLYTLEFMSELRQFYAQWFRQYGLRLVLDTASQSVKIQKEKGDEVFQLPYSSVADTLQRIIFYKTAVASNKNSVLLFEEPEAHAYPPYITEFTQEVIKSETNQFFIVTHSPIVVNDFLEEAIDDLAIFMVDFKDGQTTAKPLTREEIKEVYQYGVDLFFNNESYLS